ncbi:hypothetical protein GGR57DRAFT_471102 [Xylariaceae sp. FL1272]|nr:hypothetical protein GGR57DRAFT_471102 [Xylariaceae sp. FL1272]
MAPGGAQFVNGERALDHLSSAATTPAPSSIMKSPVSSGKTDEGHMPLANDLFTRPLSSEDSAFATPRHSAMAMHTPPRGPEISRDTATGVPSPRISPSSRAVSGSTNSFHATSQLGKRSRPAYGEDILDELDEPVAKKRTPGKDIPRQLPPFSTDEDVINLVSDDESDDVEYLYTVPVVQSHDNVKQCGLRSSTKVTNSNKALNSTKATNPTKSTNQTKSTNHTKAMKSTKRTNPTKSSKPIKPATPAVRLQPFQQLHPVSNAEYRKGDLRIEGSLSAVIEARQTGKISLRGERPWSMDDVNGFGG